jgi:hypothetical protein
VSQRCSEPEKGDGHVSWSNEEPRVDRGDVGDDTCGVSPATGEETKFSGFPGDYSQLTQGPEDGVKLGYMKTGVDFKKCRKVMLDSVVFFFAEDST